MRDIEPQLYQRRPGALFEIHGVAVRKVGRSLKALCPYRVETSPSMSIDAKKGVYHWFGCGESELRQLAVQGRDGAGLDFALLLCPLGRGAASMSPTTAPVRRTSERNRQKPIAPPDLVV